MTVYKVDRCVVAHESGVVCRQKNGHPGKHRYWTRKTPVLEWD